MIEDGLRRGAAPKGSRRSSIWGASEQRSRPLKWLIKALSSSVGKKFVMGITGLLLCGFLVGHLGGNLLLHAQAERGDGAVRAQEVV